MKLNIPWICSKEKNKNYERKITIPSTHNEAKNAIPNLHTFLNLNQSLNFITILGPSTQKIQHKLLIKNKLKQSEKGELIYMPTKFIQEPYLY